MEQLSDDVLLDIFSYLDGESLKALCKVNESWDSLIRESASTMKKFTVAISQNGERIEKKVDLESDRQSNLTIEYIRGSYVPSQSRDNDMLLSEIQPHKESVRKLKLYQIGLNMSNYYEICDGFNSLTHLTIIGCRVHFSTSSQASNRVARLANLKHLVVIGSEWKVFKMFQCDLLSLKVDSTNFYTDTAMSDFMSFLASNCTSLRVLILKNTAKHIMSAVRSYPFQLTKLSIDNLFDPKTDMAATIDFLRQQKLTLRELEVKNAPRDLVLRFILAELQLEKLNIGISQLPTELNYLKIIPKNRHLKTLVMNGLVKAVNVVEGIISQYPNIETLKFLSWAGVDTDVTDLLIHISDNLRNLQHLRIPSLQGIVSPTIDLRSLKSLHVSKIYDEAQAINWKFLAIYSPNVEKLTIKRVENCCLSNGNIELVTMKSKKLRELCLGTVFELDEQLYNIIKTTGKNLKKFIVFATQIESAKTNATRIHSGGLNCLILKSELGEIDSEFADLIGDREDLIDNSRFNTIDNVEAFIRPPVRVAQANQDNLRVRRLEEIRRRRREVFQDRRFVRQRLQIADVHEYNAFEGVVRVDSDSD